MEIQVLAKEWLPWIWRTEHYIVSKLLQQFWPQGYMIFFACLTLKFLIILVVDMCVLIFCFTFTPGLWQSILFCNFSTYMHWRWQCHGCTCWDTTWGLFLGFAIFIIKLKSHIASILLLMFSFHKFGRI